MAIPGTRIDVRPILRRVQSRETEAFLDSRFGAEILPLLTPIVLDRAQMYIEGKRVQLLPGMTVTVEIKTGSRQLISYLLSPLVRYRQEVFRER